MHLMHCVGRVRLTTSTIREDTSRSVNIFREMLHMVNRFVTKFLCLLSGMLIVELIVLMRINRCDGTGENGFVAVVFRQWILAQSCVWG